ncbi:MAG: hypothetical protein NZM38_11250 [Cytophagales bacterium]|nr:hypothetical protein [Cytophagales bacterium]MDW8385332.1 hypothetical protein [Flammeovirgaceae bacterium]
MIKFLIIAFIVIFIIARFAGYFLRFALVFLGKQIAKELHKQHQSYHNTPDGKITIQYTHKKRPLHNRNEEEYIDFQEVK